MTVLTLVSDSDREIQPLVQSAIDHELRLLEAGVCKTEHNIKKFEDQYHFSTDEFIARYERNEIDESLDAAEWIGEYRLLHRFQEKISALRGIRIAH